MERFSVIPYDKKHFNEIVNLWEEHYDQSHVHKRKVLFEWLTTKNPYLGQFSPYFVLSHDDRIVGMLGHMPLEFSVEGREKRGFISQNALLKKSYRGKGIGKILLNGITDQVKEFAGACWFNEPNHRLYLKCDWLDVPGLSPYIKILDPKYFLEKKIKIKGLMNLSAVVGKLFLKLRDAYLLPKPREGFEIFEINRFDERFDDFFERVKSLWGIIVQRKKDYLNWKFIEKPFNKYKRYGVLSEKGELEGYIIIKTERAEDVYRGKILDLLFDPNRPDIIEALMLKVLTEFKKEGVSYFSILSSTDRLTKHLKNFGFLRAQTREYFMVKNWEKDFEKDFIGNIQNWYLTYSEADGDAWNVDD